MAKEGDQLFEEKCVCRDFPNTFFLILIKFSETLFYMQNGYFQFICREMDRAIPEKPTQEVQLQNFESDLRGASEKIEPVASNPLIVKVSSESLVENKAASISGSATEETCNASSDVIKVIE